jgi:hypothetical protein
LFVEKSHSAAKTVAAKPSESFLGSMREHDDPEHNSHNREDWILGSIEKFFQHMIPALPWSDADRVPMDGLAVVPFL